jgi:hypothetical protein
MLGLVLLRLTGLTLEHFEISRSYRVSIAGAALRLSIRCTHSAPSSLNFEFGSATAILSAERD